MGTTEWLALAAVLLSIMLPLVSRVFDGSSKAIVEVKQDTTRQVDEMKAQLQMQRADIQRELAELQRDTAQAQRDAMSTQLDLAKNYVTKVEYNSDIRHLRRLVEGIAKRLHVPAIAEGDEG